MTQLFPFLKRSFHFVVASPFYDGYRVIIVFWEVYYLVSVIFTRNYCTLIGLDQLTQYLIYVNLDSGERAMFKKDTFQNATKVSGFYILL